MIQSVDQKLLSISPIDMKIILFIIFLVLSGCSTIPFCKKDQTTHCKKIDAGNMGGTVRGFHEKVE